MSNYNLSDNVKDSFEFSIDGLTYNVKYPLVEELESMQNISKEIEIKTKKGESVTELEEKSQDWMYDFITPVTNDAPSIKETLKKQNFKVMQNFNTMFKTEFGIE
jgi:hypothetical protein